MPSVPQSISFSLDRVHMLAGYDDGSFLIADTWNIDYSSVRIVFLNFTKKTRPRGLSRAFVD